MFFQIVILQNRCFRNQGFANRIFSNQFCPNPGFMAWPFGFTKWPKRPATLVSVFPNQGFAHGELALPIYPRYWLRQGFAQSKFSDNSQTVVLSNRSFQIMVSQIEAFSNPGFAESLFLKP
jgi:hypothetical protein